MEPIAADTAMRYAGVHILDNPFCIDGAFHYYIPHTMWDAVVPGAFVTVPFGRANRKQMALVTAVCEADGLPKDLKPDQIKPIGGVIRKQLFLTENQMKICFFLKEQTLCTIGEAVRTVIPGSALASLVEYYRPLPTETAPAGGSSLSAADLLIAEYIRSRGGVSGQTVKNRYGAKSALSLDRLCDKGLIERELTVHEPAVPTVTYYALSVPVSEAEAALNGEKGAVRLTSPLHKAVIRCLIEAVRRADMDPAAPAGVDPDPLVGRIPDTDLRSATGAGPAQFKALMSKGLISAQEVEAPSAPVDENTMGVRTPHSLSEEQENAVHTLETLADSGEPRAALLHGVTGSGKTCVILEMIDRMLDRGRGSIVLLPEISLTPQMLDIFHARYGRRVAVIHSGLSAGERLESHRRIQSGDAPVVVGTRSAVFAPVPHLGLIVIDEEQAHTYKSDMNPKYHARDIARFRCATEKALMLLSSATPSLESYRKAREGVYTLITMKQRYGQAALPRVDIVDMRNESGSGNLTPIGTRLQTELNRVHGEGNQSVLFLNRRGYSHQLVCRSCGQAVTCPRCSVAMNFHAEKGHSERGVMVCHWCGTREPVPAVCPNCGSPHLMRMGFGTQRVEEDLGVLVPGSRVLRMDADTTSTKTAFHDLLGRFRRHEADILLGTQMVTKGHDFPDVTLVGVLMADMSLYLDDYRANERTFSLLTQVIGRAGRSDKAGLAIIQTMNPGNDILKLACAQDYETFYEREIRLRKLLQFPPFCDMVLLTVTSPDEKELQKACLRLSEELAALCREDFPEVPLISFGPFEAPVYRVDNVFRMRVVVKCRLNRASRALFAALLTRFASNARGGRKPVLSVDFNPSSI